MSVKIWGAGKPERAEQIGKKSAFIGFFLLAIIGIIFHVFAYSLAETFIPGDKEVIEKAAIFIRFLTISFPFFCLQIILDGIYAGSGNTKVTMIFSLIALWVFEFPVAYILSRHTPLAENGLWIAYPISNFIVATISFIYFRMGRWKKTRIIQPPEEKLEKAVKEEALIEEGIQ